MSQLFDVIDYTKIENSHSGPKIEQISNFEKKNFFVIMKNHEKIIKYFFFLNWLIWWLKWRAQRADHFIQICLWSKIYLLRVMELARWQIFQEKTVILPYRTVGMFVEFAPRWIFSWMYNEWREPKSKNKFGQSLLGNLLSKFLKWLKSVSAIFRAILSDTVNFNECPPTCRFRLRPKNRQNARK